MTHDVSIYTMETGKHYEAELPLHTLPKEPRLVGRDLYQIFCLSDFTASKVFVIELLESETTSF